MDHSLLSGLRSRDVAMPIHGRRRERPGLAEESTRKLSRCRPRQRVRRLYPPSATAAVEVKTSDRSGERWNTGAELPQGLGDKGS